MTTAGTIALDKVFYKLDVTHTFKHVLVVSNGRPPGTRPKKSGVSPKS